MPDNVTPEATADTEARPDFTAFSPAARMLVEMLYDAERSYSAAHGAVYGERSASRKAWEASLTTTPDVDSIMGEGTAERVDEVVRLGDDPSEVLSVLLWLQAQVKAAKDNLAGLYATSKGVTLDGEGPDVAELRAQFDALLASCVSLASTPVLDEDSLWSLIPHKRTEARVTKSGRRYAASVRYDGPSIPTQRAASVKSNSRLTLVVNGTPYPGNLGEMVKLHLRLTMSELREQWGDFTASATSDERLIETGDGRTVTVQLVKAD